MFELPLNIFHICPVTLWMYDIKNPHLSVRVRVGDNVRITPTFLSVPRTHTIRQGT